jgi:hypothetical protein
MLGHEPFYHQHFKKYTVIMGTLLNGISIIREMNGKTTRIRVPVSFGDVNKHLNRVRSDPDFQKIWRTYLPRIVFTQGDPSYDPSRKDNANYQGAYTSDGLRRSTTFPAVPYDIPYTVTIVTEYREDALQIVEQILPFFQPEYTVRAKEVPEFGIERDVHIDLASVSVAHDYTGEMRDYEPVMWEIQFNLRGWLYGPFEDQSVIKRSIVEFIFDPDEEFTVKTTAEVSPLSATEDEQHDIIVTTIER